MKTALKERRNAPQGLTLNRTELDRRAAMQSTCTVHDCSRKRKSRGLCNTHYERLRRTGTIDYRPPTPEERFWAKVDATGICWEWTAALSDTGYGSFRLGNGIGAHRAAWQFLVGEIPSGLVLDHLCRNRRCVNPDHLEPVTQQVNAARGGAPTHVLARSGMCHKGHTLTAEDYVHRSDGRVTALCRKCARARQSKLREGDTEWRGVTALRALAFDLENLETTNHNEQEQR